MPKRTDLQSILILGSGPIVIGQAVGSLTAWLGCMSAGKPRLDQLEREPLPMFFNWLSMAYSSLGDHKGMEAVIRENYRANPQYLFARLNYAELCLRDSDLDGVREALGPGFDIRALLGGRKRVHVWEVAGYFYAVGLYQIETGDREAAEKMYELLEEVAPGERPTEELRRRLHPRLRDLFSR